MLDDPRQGFQAGAIRREIEGVRRLTRSIRRHTLSVRHAGLSLSSTHRHNGGRTSCCRYSSQALSNRATVFFMSLSPQQSPQSSMAFFWNLTASSAFPVLNLARASVSTNIQLP